MSGMGQIRFQRKLRYYRRGGEVLLTVTDRAVSASGKSGHWEVALRDLLPATFGHVQDGLFFGGSHCVNVVIRGGGAYSVKCASRAESQEVARQINAAIEDAQQPVHRTAEASALEALELRKQGLVTDEEFEAKRTEILRRL
jgi:hypothetical protein